MFTLYTRRSFRKSREGGSIFNSRSINSTNQLFFVWEGENQKFTNSRSSTHTNTDLVGYSGTLCNDRLIYRLIELVAIEQNSFINAHLENWYFCLSLKKNVPSASFLHISFKYIISGNLRFIRHLMKRLHQSSNHFYFFSVPPVWQKYPRSRNIFIKCTHYCATPLTKILQCCDPFDP